TTLCGSDRAAHSGIASSRRGLRSSLEVLLTILPAVAYHHRSVPIRSASVQGTLVPRASMRAGDTHRTAAKVSWGLQARENAALERIEDGDATGERPTGMREGRRCEGTDGSGCSAWCSSAAPSGVCTRRTSAVCRRHSASWAPTIKFVSAPSMIPKCRGQRVISRKRAPVVLYLQLAAPSHRLKTGYNALIAPPV